MPLQPNGLGPGEEPYTPVLTASTTNPSLGTGGSAVGGWQRVSGSLIWWWLKPFIFDVSDAAGVMSLLVSHEAPFTWAEGDNINVSGIYQMLG